MKMEINEETKLKNLIKEALRDVLEEEVAKLRLLAVTFVSDEEQKEIEESYDVPTKEVSRTIILKE